MSEQQVYDFLEHAGVKGMKWGVRQQNRLNTARAVAKGKGTFGDKASVRGSNSLISNLRNPFSARKLAARNVMKLEERKKRTLKGQRTAGDILDKFGLIRL